MLHALIVFALIAPTSELPDSADARRKAVEEALCSSPWVAGHTFDILERMDALNVPGAGIAVIHGGRIDWAAGYGVRDARSGEPVTLDTLFQAASISKSVSALCALRLAQEGRLDLDAPINDVLESWQLPDDGFEGAVTARLILSHTAGLGVHGFPGYGTYEPAASVVEVLDGKGRANTSAVRRIQPVGQGVRYSGGGSTILQLALMDTAGTDFATLTHALALAPMGMERSTYAQPLDVERWPDHSSAHTRDGRVAVGGFHVYPEQHAAGLWTTPSDIARFALELQAALAGDGERVLTGEWARTMLEPQADNAALGLFIEEHAGQSWFTHGGSNHGFKCDFRASFAGGRGLAVMTNGDQGSELANEILRAVASVYGWPGFVEDPLPAGEPAAELAAYLGRYGVGPDEVAFVREFGGGLSLQRYPSPQRRLVPLGGHTFLVHGTDQRLTFEDVGEGGAALLRVGGVRATRLDDYERWPIDDLLQGDFEQATSVYADVYAANPTDPMVDVERLMQLQASLWNEGRLDAGLAIAQLMVELLPTHPGAWENLGQLRASNGEREAAIAAYSECLARCSDDAPIDTGTRAYLERLASSMLLALE